jgi:hypothetical protein
MSRFGWAYVSSVLTGAVANGPTNSIQFNAGSSVLNGSSNFTFDPVTNTVYLTGALKADTLIISSSQIFKSGSTIFGDSAGDTHQFTGSIYNTVLVSGTNAQFVSITGSGGGLKNIPNAALTNSTVTIGATSIGLGSSAVIIQGISELTASVITGSGNITMAGDAIINGAIRGLGAFKANYTAYTASYTVAKTDYFMAISGTTAVTASLQAATNYLAGQKLIFKDTSGAANAAGRNIRISPIGGNNIDGGGDIIINTSFGFKTLICDGTSKFYTVG